VPKRLLNILFEKTIKIFFVFGIVFLASDPGLVIGFPLGTVCVINVKNTSTRHCRGGGELQVTDLKNEAHVGLKHDTFIGGESEDFVVVHDRVHRFDPVSVEITIKNDPLRVSVLDLGKGTQGF
jgi:hypothetical protein